MKLSTCYQIWSMSSVNTKATRPTILLVETGNFISEEW